MQPFDSATFDTRYEEIFKPAIIAAGLVPHRVEKDPGVRFPIAKIERGIWGAALCFADITEDDPTVWFALGYAIACSKEVVLVCSSERITELPLDLQHRTIISSDAPSESLKEQITGNLAAYINKTTCVRLEQYEMDLLEILAANVDHPRDWYPPNFILPKMKNKGHSNLETNLALDKLSQRHYIELQVDGEQHARYLLTGKGWDWIAAKGLS